jgi:hypothetical protein
MEIRIEHIEEQFEGIIHTEMPVIPKVGEELFLWIDDEGIWLFVVTNVMYHFKGQNNEFDHVHLFVKGKVG